MRPARRRFSILTMMGVIASFALVTAALGDPSDLWSSIAFSMAIAAVGFALICSITLSDRDRLPWIGSALIGGSYLLMSFGPWFSTEVRPHLLTTPMMDWLYPRLHNAPALARGLSGPMLHVLIGPHEHTYETAEHYLQNRGAQLQMNYERIGHSLASMACGLVGAGLVRFLSRRIEGQDGISPST